MLLEHEDEDRTRHEAKVSHASFYQLIYRALYVMHLELIIFLLTYGSVRSSVYTDHAFSFYVLM